MNKHYQKLVRDKITDIIVSQNKICVFRKLLKDEEIFEARKNKVLEELEELRQAIISEDNDSIREELADFIEIFYFWTMGKYSNNFLQGIDMDIESKIEKAGSFENNYFLEEVQENKCN